MVLLLHMYGFSKHAENDVLILMEDAHGDIGKRRGNRAKLTPTRDRAG
jgi:hypothetical protein